jgi:hypothetical protein
MYPAGILHTPTATCHSGLPNKRRRLIL